ncbi:glutamate-rich WD repeat-containing protein 1-like, partial [Fopius arisanus]
MDSEEMEYKNEEMDEDESEDEMDESMEDKDSVKNDESKPEVYLPGRVLEKGEELVVDMSAYRMLHQAQTGAP